MEINHIGNIHNSVSIVLNEYTYTMEKKDFGWFVQIWHDHGGLLDDMIFECTPRHAWEVLYSMVRYYGCHESGY